MSNASVNSLNGASDFITTASAASAARAFVAAAAEGRISGADELLPWPPPPPLWRERTGSAIFATAAVSREQQQQPKLWLQQQQFLLSLNEPKIDAVLGGGLPAGMLGEVCGSAGAGKTQFALTLTAECLLQQFQQQRWHAVKIPIEEQYNGAFSGGAVFGARTSTEVKGHAEVESTGVVFYIHSEGSFPAERLHCILSRRLERLRRLAAVQGAAFECENTTGENWASTVASQLLSRVFVEEVGSEEEAVDCLLYKVPRLFVSQGRIALLIVDSVAALFKHEMQAQLAAQGTASSPSAASRSTKLIRFGAVLRRIAAEYRCSCLTLNHVSALMNSDSNSEREISEVPHSASAADALKRRRTAQDRNGVLIREHVRSLDAGLAGKSVGMAHWAAAEALSAVRPALGPIWSGCLNYRIFLSRVELAPFDCEYRRPLPNGFHCLRSLFVVFAPHCPERGALFAVNERGIVDEEDVECSQTV